MGTVLASAILAKADTTLLDTAKTRWPDAEKLKYLNEGQRESVILKPSAYTLNVAYQLVAGTKQSIPDGSATFQDPSGATIAEAIQFIRLVRNMGLTGLVAGPAITPVGMDFMDAYNPDWHTDTAAAVVKHFIFNEDDPTHFYVTPPQPTGAGAQNYVEAVFSAVPAEIAEVGNAITLSDVYQDILLNYVIYRCYAKDAALSPFNAQRAAEYYNLFVLGLERKDLVMKQYSPNVKRPSPSTE